MDVTTLPDEIICQACTETLKVDKKKAQYYDDFAIMCPNCGRINPVTPKA